MGSVGTSRGHPDAEVNAIYFVQLKETRFETRKLFAEPTIGSLGGKIMNEKLPLVGRVRVRDSFMTLIDRKIRERRRDERRLAEHRTTKHQLQARNSCVADARSYRVARRLPVLAPAQFDWKTLISVERLNKVRSACFDKFRDHQFERWLSAK